jgi:Cu2+-exporting ATPase
MRSPDACLHCGQPAVGDNGFCCFGCRTVYYALRSSGLMRYYDLRGDRAEPVGELGLERRDRSWLEALEAIAEEPREQRAIALQVQGIRCAACVWLLEQLFARHALGLRLVVNPALGRADLTVARGFDLRAFVDDVERFGYLVAPASASAEQGGSDGLLLRLGICAALAMNSMMFAAAGYFGLREGPLHELLHRLNYGAATLAVVIGGPVFIGSAWHALKRRVLHLDVPIALGILLSFAAATWSLLAGRREAAYFDSLAVFTTLMLLGRYLQERALLRNRRALLADDGAGSLRSRRIRGDRVEVVASRKLRAGDEVLLAPGDLVPADAELLDASASVSLDWINGEAEPRRFRAGETLRAGAFNIGLQAVRVRLRCDFAQSELVVLLRTPAQHTYVDRRWSDFVRRYVAFVLIAAGAGLGYWALVRHELIFGLSVATAVCVITCPCAIGIAIPLAYEWAHAGLRRHGLFVRSASFLDRARSVRTVVFDKTGTLTTGQPRIVAPERLRALPLAQRRALYDLVCRSLHPKSIAIKRVLDGSHVDYRRDVAVVEQPGLGLEARIGGQLHRLGRPDWACGGADGDLAYGIDGRAVLAIRTEEELRPDAARELARLAALGCDLYILSGDDPARVQALAQRLPLAPGHALGGLSPDDKARWVREHDRADLLMIGDGINDGPASAAAHCSGTPAIDRALMPGRSDFYFTTAGLAPVRVALQAGRKLGHVIRTNVAFTLVYNVATVAAALAGLMQPWIAAVLMPLSSIAVLLRTSAALCEGSRAWRS